MAPAERFRTAVTVCLVEEARRGPFVLHTEAMPGGLAAACRAAADAGFDAIELFPAGGPAFPAAGLQGLLPTHGLALAAVGTGAGGRPATASRFSTSHSIATRPIASTSRPWQRSGSPAGVSPM